jgi:hypothetical protein
LKRSSWSKGCGATFKERVRIFLGGGSFTAAFLFMSNPFRHCFLAAVVALLATHDASGQDLPANPLAARFVGAWKLERVQTQDGLQVQPPVVEFRTIVATDGTLLQGLYPEGMFESAWRFDAVAMRVHMTDMQSAATHVLRVLQLTGQSLVLEVSDRDSRTLMYYASLR